MPLNNPILGFDLVRAIFPGPVKHFVMPTNAGWTTTAVGGGSLVVSDPVYMVLRAAAPANSSIIARDAGGFLNSNTLGINMADWNKRLLLIANIVATPSDAQATRFMQLKEAVTIGQLAQLGIGIAMANLTLTGEAYGTSRGTLAFTTNLTNNQPALLAILLTTSGVEFFFNNVSQGRITTANTFPSGNGLAQASFLFSNANGAAGTQGDLYVGGIHLFQEI